jgi:hypothetical protein
MKKTGVRNLKLNRETLRVVRGGLGSTTVGSYCCVPDTGLCTDLTNCCATQYTCGCSAVCESAHCAGSRNCV